MKTLPYCPIIGALNMMNDLSLFLWSYAIKSRQIMEDSLWNFNKLCLKINKPRRGALPSPY